MTLIAGGGVRDLGKGDGFNSLSVGVAGVLSMRGTLGMLEAFGVAVVDGWSRKERSWDETAPERRCAWPLLPAGGPGFRVKFGGGKPPSIFVGLELMGTMVPVLLVPPPMNSLAPRLWPKFFEGVVGELEVGVSGGVVVDGTGDRAGVPGLKLKSGRALAERRLLASGLVRLGVGKNWREVGRLGTSEGGESGDG